MPRLTRSRTPRSKRKCKRCGNVRPAPFFLSPATVGALIGLMDARAVRAVDVPVLPIKLVDRPRRSQDPRLAKANDNPVSAPDRVVPSAEMSAPVEPATANTPIEPDWPDAPLPDPMPEAPADPVSDPDLDRPDVAPVDVARRPVRVRERPIDLIVTPPAPGASRIELIRAAAARLAARKAAPRPVYGAAVPTPQAPIPANPAESRLAMQARAIAYLNAHGLFVSVVDREAKVRTFRVAGRQGNMLPDDLIRFAVRKGMEAGA